MDKRLILSFLLVTLSLEFMATSAQSNATTVAPSSNATTVAPSSNATTVVPSSNATTVAPANNATTVAPANNATTVAASNATTVAPNTLPAVATISRQECGSSKLCAAEPSECSPASGSCYFLSAKQQSGQNYSFELSGQSDGYIAAGVSSTASQTARHRAYICANNNGAVRFFTGFINNLVLNLTESLDSSNQRGSINSGKIQCTFSAVLPDTTTRAAGYSLSVTTGPYDSSSGQPGTASFRILTPVVNLSDPTANVSNLLSNSTSSAYPVTHTHSFLPVLLVTVSMLAFTTA
ncbi:putative ferric-chelate reductase 1 isoform X3 [Poeciliopsis prolifica]|uniref:putative ferric-chelate reductase 1 isoform X3 n=1 Tax=Poeciliopsis prolifica TaxID=188132 RepID=UPI00241424FC|nr:putative ferric-chelate reductase 1 isoform X3 [Poeciliopsis prolifica]